MKMPYIEGQSFDSRWDIERSFRDAATEERDKDLVAAVAAHTAAMKAKPHELLPIPPIVPARPYYRHPLWACVTDKPVMKTGVYLNFKGGVYFSDPSPL